MSAPPVVFKMMSFETPVPPRPATAPKVVGRRFLAGTIDLLVGFALFLLTAATIGTFDTSHGFVVRLDGTPALVWVAAILLYCFLSEAHAGQTLGKALTDLRVVDATTGGPAPPRAIAIRTLLRLIDALPIFYALGAFVIAITPTGQRLGDLAAQTTVIRTRR
jgi:uncharacterized RDD family membrane protein YckC